jgi:heme/copper-type cytochrome/quinol oxidase subunit 4
LTGTSLWHGRGDSWEGRRDWIIIGALALFALFFRLATLMMMNTGVDERDYWFSAKTIASGFPYPDISHRTTRFAIILPVTLAQALLGSHPDVYYVLPVLNAMVQTGLAYALGLTLRGRLTGFLAAWGLTLFPYMVRAGSQVRPEVFSITYMLLVFLFFAEYLQRDVREIPPLLWSAALLFVAYESKITNLFFAPGMFLAIVLYKRKYAQAFLFAGSLLFLFLAETAAYALFTQYKLGELEIILKNHFHPDSLVVPRIIDLFQRYAPANLQLYWQVPFAVFGAAAVFYLARNVDRRISGLVLASLSFFIILTFEVKSLNPITPAESFINRYFCAVLPSVFLVLAYAAEGVVRRFKSEGTDSVVPYVSALALCAAAVLVVFSLPGLPEGLRKYANSPLHPRRHPLVLNGEYRKLVNDAFSNGIPIVSAEGIGGDNAIQTCESFFIDSSHYRKGRPPRHVIASAGSTSYLVLSREGAGVSTDRVLAAIRSPFRLIPVPAADISLLTDDSVDGKRKPTDEDDDQ